ncbi:unnamed protein product [Rotaria magnacalcarata]|uniref:Uncharacterized protein n=1 Tax=Rotaria magnacalcarata TaxID=392030 RepID=A0A815ASW8_9BILA|nr:unnamed protein product [Rotaria magnacalcarata]CAF1260264.1 unnamed protein product [Rotaria magnacalcarata]CAF2054710.1 unnamed protein product [Rotaria magnacalcarata]CAF2134825.1 unnamed protein product [Rotaria magnacalcarata]CAF2255456.1 unnamed protein product [Rotaria magnacalcarata]
MYSIRRDPNKSHYWMMNCRQQQNQEIIFHNRQMIKANQHYFSSTGVHNNRDCSIHYQTINDSSMKSNDFLNEQDLALPIYRAPCTFQSSLITASKDDHLHAICHRSPVSSCSSSCVPDVYSPGLSSSGNCSPPPPSANLPPPPSEWLN